MSSRAPTSKVTFGEESFAEVGRGIRLCYQQIGDHANEPLVLVMGLGTQMIGWPDELCAMLAGHGFLVTRFDNRDIGRSTKLRDVRPPGLHNLLLRSGAAYRLADMADDTWGLLDHLGLKATHLVGASMGGMIAQTMAARHPHRVKTLTSIMSGTGSRLSGQPSPSALRLFLRRPPRHRDEAAERMVETFAAIGSPGFDRDEGELRRLIASSIDRSEGGGDTAGSGRQLMAILASGNRASELERITAPTLVIHGTEDKLVSPSGGKATARAIPDARLELIEGMGHDLPRGTWERLVKLIAEHARSATD